MVKTPHPVDVHVGTQLRVRRMVIGMSQEKLGQHLGLTFQQIQKYEKGLNRIGASRLYSISRILDTPVEYFFEDMGEDTSTPPDGEAAPGAPRLRAVNRFLATSEGLKLNIAFAKIRDPATRRRLAALVSTLADETAT